MNNYFAFSSKTILLLSQAKMRYVAWHVSLCLHHRIFFKKASKEHARINGLLFSVNVGMKGGRRANLGEFPIALCRQGWLPLCLFKNGFFECSLFLTPPGFQTELCSMTSTANEQGKRWREGERVSGWKTKSVLAFHEEWERSKFISALEREREKERADEIASDESKEWNNLCRWSRKSSVAAGWHLNSNSFEALDV